MKAKIQNSSYNYQRLFFLLLIISTALIQFRCSNSVSDTGGGIEAGNSIMAIQVLNGSTEMGFEILPSSYYAPNEELDSFAILDTFTGNAVKEITLKTDTYSLLITNFSDGKQCLVQDIVLLEKEKSSVSCSLVTTGKFVIVDAEKEWRSGTYFFIPGTSLKYNVEEDTDSISWELPAAHFDSIFVVHSGSLDSIELLTVDISIVSDKVSTFKKLSKTVISNSSSSRFANIIIDKNSQKIWIGCTPDNSEGKNLFQYDDVTKVWKSYTSASTTYLSDGVTALASKQNGDIWIGTPEGLLEFRDNSTFYYYKTFSNGSNDTRSILIDETDNIWIAYSSYINKHTPISNHTISGGRTIIKDLSNNLWIGTDSDGVYKLNESLGIISNYTADNSELISDTIISSCVDSSGLLWFSTPVGLTSFDATNWVSYTQFSGDAKVTKIKSNSLTGDIWFITEDNSLYQISNGQFIKIEYGLSELNENAELVDLFIASDTVIWLLVKNVGIINIAL